MPECGEACGLASAFVAALAFGSYGVPMKGEAATKVDVDPLVFQTYKTFMVFVTSWSVLLLGIKPTFTPWGIVSATFWVPGGTAGIYAVRRAGLAVSVGIWSSVIVFVSFLWGIGIFHEEVNSISGTVCAAVLLCVGLWGIAFYSSPGHQKTHARAVRQQQVDCDSRQVGDDDGVQSYEGRSDDVETPLNWQGKEEYGTEQQQQQTGETAKINDDDDKGYVNLDLEHYPHSGAPPCGEKDVYDLIHVHDTQYHFGLAMAALNGLLAATIMVPLHYAGPEARGLSFSISFGIGAVIVTAVMWVLRLVHLTHKMGGSLTAGYDSLPPFHFQVMWKPGCLAGLLYSIGSFGSILAITTLGDFLGYSLGQSSLLVSGLWGIFWYREVTYVGDIVGWLASACVVLGSILWLSREHVQ